MPCYQNVCYQDPITKMSVTKMSVTKMSYYRNVLLPKCPVTKVSFTEMSGYRLEGVMYEGGFIRPLIEQVCQESKVSSALSNPEDWILWYIRTYLYKSAINKTKMFSWVI